MAVPDGLLSRCMGLNAQIDRGGGSSPLLSPARDERTCEARRGQPIKRGRAARAIRQPDGSVGVLHYHGGDPQVAGDVLHPAAAGAMLPGIAIAARRAASLAAMHAAALAAADRRGAAGGTAPGAGAGAAAGGAGQFVRLPGVVSGGGGRFGGHCGDGISSMGPMLSARQDA